jgi:hypothetical protein
LAQPFSADQYGNATFYVSPASYLVQVRVNGTITYSYAYQVSAAGLFNPVLISQGGTGATTAAGALANLGGLPLSGGTLTGALNGTSASFSGTLVAGSETLGSPLLPASGGTGATTAAGALTNLGGVALTGGVMTGALTATQFNGPLTGNVTGNVTGTASNVTGTVPLGNGGTGATTAAGALANLGGLPLTGGTLTGALTGTSASFSGTVVAGTPIGLTNGGTGATTAAGALANLGGLPLTGGTLTGPTTINSTLAAQNITSIGPRYDVTLFGAYGTGLSTTGSVNIVTNSSLLTLSTAINVPTGAYLVIPGAGVSGANLLAQVVSGGSTTNLTFTPAATTSVSGVIIDDTAGIQQAFDTCMGSSSSNSLIARYATYLANSNSIGGIIEFPGTHTYVVSSTIYAHWGCPVEGTVANAGYSGTTPYVKYTAASPSASVATVSSYVITSYNTFNTTSAQPAWLYQVTFTTTSAHGFTPGQWIELSGFTSAIGTGFNRVQTQVQAAGWDSTHFTVVLPVASTATTSISDSGNVTPINVGFAFDQNARYDQWIENISLLPGTGGYFNTGIFFASRVDTGTTILNTSVSSAKEYGYYFAQGGINVSFDRGWRSQGVLQAGIYWRGVADNLKLANGTVDNNAGTNMTPSGGVIVLDDSYCTNNSSINLNIDHVKFESNSTIQNGMGMVTMLDCPSQSGPAPFQISLDSVWNAPSSDGIAGFNFPSLVMIPANDNALVLHVSNSQLRSGVSPNTTIPFVGLPLLSRQILTGARGVIPLLSYATPGNSYGQYSDFRSLATLAGDTNVGQLWQNNVKASPLLYSDTAFAALPNGTTLYFGQVIAPPTYWVTGGATGKRYAMQVVTATGTTGTPNGGATTCSTTGTAYQLVCSSVADLSPGQVLSLNGTVQSHPISYVDASNPSSMLVWLTGGIAGGPYTNATLTFGAPVLGLEMQMPTKSSAAPTTLAWSQGDMEQNSGATANGVAAWVNVAAGTPGTWAGIPLGNSSGILTPAQAGAEPALGNPSTNGYILSSSTAGVRSWTAPATFPFTETGTLNLTTPQISITDTGTSGTGQQIVSYTASSSAGNAYWQQMSASGTASFFKWNDGSVNIGTYFWGQNGLNWPHDMFLNAPTLATNGTNQASPYMKWCANGFSTTATASEPICLQGRITCPNTAQTPSCTFGFGLTQNANLSGTMGISFGTVPVAVSAIQQIAVSTTGGTCSMAATTSCTITIATTYTTPVCIATQQSATLTGGDVGCTVSGTTVTITSAVANSETWGAFVFGNPK